MLRRRVTNLEERMARMQKDYVRLSIMASKGRDASDEVKELRDALWSLFVEGKSGRLDELVGKLKSL